MPLALPRGIPVGVTGMRGIHGLTVHTNATECSTAQDQFGITMYLNVIRLRRVRLQAVAGRVGCVIKCAITVGCTHLATRAGVVRALKEDAVIQVRLASLNTTEMHAGAHAHVYTHTHTHTHSYKHTQEREIAPW